MTNMGGCEKIKNNKKEEEVECYREAEWGEDFLLARSNLAAAQAPILKSH